MNKKKYIIFVIFLIIVVWLLIDNYEAKEMHNLVNNTVISIKDFHNVDTVNDTSNSIDNSINEIYE